MLSRTFIQVILIGFVPWLQRVHQEPLNSWEGPRVEDWPGSEQLMVTRGECRGSTTAQAEATAECNEAGRIEVSASIQGSHDDFVDLEHNVELEEPD